MRNLYGNLPKTSAQELFETLTQNNNSRLERIVSYGHKSPHDFWYDQDQDEWVVVLKGSAQISLKKPDETVVLKEGDFLCLKAHRKHRVDWTDANVKTIWLALYF